MCSVRGLFLTYTSTCVVIITDNKLKFGSKNLLLLFVYSGANCHWRSWIGSWCQIPQRCSHRWVGQRSCNCDESSWIWGSKWLWDNPHRSSLINEKQIDDEFYNFQQLLNNFKLFIPPHLFVDFWSYEMAVLVCGWQNIILILNAVILFWTLVVLNKNQVSIVNQVLQT